MSKVLEKEELNKVIETVMARSAIDAEFRKLCIENPKGAIEQQSGKLVPEGGAIPVFIAKEVSHVIPLPDFFAEESLIPDGTISKALASYVALSDEDQPCLSHLSD
jgi:hypothetical protein